MQREQLREHPKLIDPAAPGYTFGYRIRGTFGDQRQGETRVMVIECELCWAALIEDPKNVEGVMRLHTAWHKANGHVAAPLPEPPTEEGTT